MLKLLFANNQHSDSGDAARYFLEFADEINADVTVLSPSGKGRRSPAIFYPDRISRLTGSFLYSGNFVQEAVVSSRNFSYDLILASQECKKKWFENCPARNIARKAWAPVLLIPKQSLFKPFEKVLFLDDQDYAASQPILRKLSGIWRQQHFLYPAMMRRRGAGYSNRRFDETGYPVVPRPDAGSLHRYIERHGIGLVVANESSSNLSHRVLEELPAPVLVFNSRNTVCSRPEKQPTTLPSVRKLFRVGKIS